MLSRGRWLVVYFTALFAVILPFGLILWSQALETLPRKELKVLRLVHDAIVDHYVETRDPDELLVEAIKGMVGSLDRYSSFVPAEEVHEFVGSQLEGTFQGIGVLLFPKVSPLTVQSPLPEGPAERAGIRVGDRILAVDGLDISDVPPEEVLDRAQELIRGPAGTRVTLTIGRGDDPPFRLELARGDVPQRKVRWAHLIDPELRIGYLWIEGFQRNVTEELDEDLAWLLAQADGALGGLILDLRHDPGGPLQEAVTVTNRFLASGDIVQLVRRDSVVVERHEAKPELCALPDVPLVVLIDAASASASEVVTGALQDHGRARIVGVRSYGKGVVQSIYSWQDLDFRLKLTTSFYLTPSGRSIDRSRNEPGEGGILPDVVVELPEESYHAVISRLTALEVPRPYRDAAAALAERLGVPMPKPPSADLDPQLAAALEEAKRLVYGAKENR